MYIHEGIFSVSQGHKNNEEHRSLGLFGLLRKESWGPKGDNSKGKSKGRVTFALPRTDSKKKKKAKAEGRLKTYFHRLLAVQLTITQIDTK